MEPWLRLGQCSEFALLIAFLGLSKGLLGVPQQHLSRRAPSSRCWCRPMCGIDATQPHRHQGEPAPRLVLRRGYTAWCLQDKWRRPGFKWLPQVQAMPRRDRRPARNRQPEKWRVFVLVDRNNHFAVLHPAKCWMAPEIPTAMYRSGATILPVCPT